MNPHATHRAKKARPRRNYTKVRRAAAEEETRRRIVEALIELHAAVGPARTTVSAVAEHAGVERLTVYRHFPDERSMFAACSTAYQERNPPPDPASFDGDDPLIAVRRTLISVYSWYRANEAMFANVLTDLERMPALRESTEGIRMYATAVAVRLDAAFPRRSARRRTTLQHVLEFQTWRSLARLAASDRAAADIAARWVEAAS